eukprot:TRINITY_DN4197_c0_g1_i3.p1 TRINITY_DN4197_c0_g1~~TRINITY_DN4197_c0_g1_i3.p1  ORF type:complete len:213 (-),score=69.19 TRINITY_DN4197_c0_g1_i3:123-761(-)
MLRSLVGSEMCIRDSINAEYGGRSSQIMPEEVRDVCAQDAVQSKRKRGNDQEEEEEEDDEFEVEKIMKKRKNNGRLEYFVKWKNFSTTENTWEPMSNLVTAQDLVKAFEEQQRQKDEDGGKKKAGVNDVSIDDVENLPESRDSKKESVLEQILGARKDPKSGTLEFLCKWLDCSKANMEPASVMNVKHPQAVIAFYEERLRFEDPVQAGLSL